jgi:catabolite regulation protein CreA
MIGLDFKLSASLNASLAVSSKIVNGSPPNAISVVPIQPWTPK